MSFVTTALAVGEDAGFDTPPDPCPHSGAATSAATSGVADHRARYLIPTSVERRILLPRTERKPHVQVASGSGLIIAPRSRVDNHRADVGPVEQVVAAEERAQPHAPCRSAPPQAHVGGPPGTGGRVETDRKSTRLNSSHDQISYAVFCLKKK